MTRAEIARGASRKQLPREFQMQDQRIEAIAEVVASSITGLVAESWQDGGAAGCALPVRPRFGSFLRADCEEEGMSVVAVVYDVVTGPQDTIHKPAALGLSREQLRLEQPHIFALLKTEIHALTIGYSIANRVYQHLPPRPPQVHDFVYPLSDAQIGAVTENLNFLGLVASVSTVPADELLAATVREACRARGNDYPFLVEAGKALSRLFRDDYDRLVAVLKKVQSD